MKTAHVAQSAKARTLRAPAKRARAEDRYLASLLRLMARETGKAVQLEFVANPDSKVYVAGSFNNWDPTTHPLSHHPEDGVFRATLLLPAGTHQYKFVVNGVWHMDAKCPHWVPNEHGTLNSVVRI